MIWKLTREQLRSQRRFVAWTAALLTAAIALASFAAISTTTQISNDLHAQRIEGYDDLYMGYANSSVNDPDDADGASYVSTAEVDAQIQAAIESGSDIQVSRDTYLWATGAAMNQMYSSFIVAIGGEYSWEDILVEGRAPASGEIALSRRIADDIDVGIGDSIDVHREVLHWDENPLAVVPGVSLTVSGITATPGSGRNYDVGLPEAIASWDDGLDLARAGHDLREDEVGELMIYTEASWNTATTDLTAFEVSFGEYYGSTAGRSDGAGISIAISVAIFVGLIAMSFAVGRSQAQARTTWAATARAMGARRGTIAAATVAETLIIGLVASVVGIVLGWLAVVTDLAFIHAKVPDVFLPSAPVVVWWVIGLVLLLGVAISAIIGAVPAFWASRVSPVAALKPVTPLAEAEVSRRVSVRNLVVVWAICLAGLWFVTAVNASDDILFLLAIAFSISAIVLSFALALELLRETMPRLGRRLGRSPRPWSIAAGDAIASRPRQSAIAALIMAMVAFCGAIIFTYVFLDEWLTTTMWGVDLDPGLTGVTVGITQSSGLAVFAGATALAVLIALAIFTSGARESQSDNATRTALGLTTADSRLARSTHFGLPLAVGLSLGMVTGFTTALMLSLSRNTEEMGVGSWWLLSAVPHTILPNLTIACVGLALIAVGAGIVAATTSRRTPVEDLARV